MNNPAPSAEAKATAIQIRDTLLKALEAAIENQWGAVSDSCHTVLSLAEHCRRIETSYRYVCDSEDGHPCDYPPFHRESD